LRTIFLWIYILIIPVSIFPQNNAEEIIAEVGDDKISSSEFIELYELTPHIAEDNINSFQGKLNFLNTIIAYKLWSQNKESLNIDYALPYRTAVSEIRKMFIRDALYRKEILGRIDISPAEFAEAKLMYERKLEVKYLLPHDEDEANNLLLLLEAGCSFDSLLLQREESSYQKEPVIISFGDYNESAEKLLYALKPGEYSSVIKFKDADYIFQLKRVLPRYDDEEKEREAVNNVLKKRKEAVLYELFIKRILNGAKADVNRALFGKVEQQLVNVYAGTNSEKGKDSLIALSTDDFLKIENSFTEEELNSVFITFTHGTLLLRDVLRGMFFTGIKMPGTAPQPVKETFNNYVKDFIAKEIFYNEGVKQGLEYMPDVQKYIKIWTDFYAFETARGEMLDTMQVTSEEIETAYREQYKNKLTGSRSPEEAKAVLHKTIALNKLNNIITEKTAGFASAKTININYDLLRAIEITKINSLVIRNLGFGGTINAVPLYIPNYKWIYSEKSSYPLP